MTQKNKRTHQLVEPEGLKTCYWVRLGIAAFHEDWPGLKSAANAIRSGSTLLIQGLHQTLCDAAHTKLVRVSRPLQTQVRVLATQTMPLNLQRASLSLQAPLPPPNATAPPPSTAFDATGTQPQAAADVDDVLSATPVPAAADDGAARRGVRRYGECKAGTVACEHKQSV